LGSSTTSFENGPGAGVLFGVVRDSIYVSIGATAAVAET